MTKIMGKLLVAPREMKWLLLAGECIARPHTVTPHTLTVNCLLWLLHTLTCTRIQTVMLSQFTHSHSCGVLVLVCHSSTHATLTSPSRHCTRSKFRFTISRESYYERTWTNQRKGIKSHDLPPQIAHVQRTGNQIKVDQRKNYTVLKFFLIIIQIFFFLLNFCFSMASSWEFAQKVVATEKKYLFTQPQRILLFPGLLSEYSAYDFAQNAYKVCEGRRCHLDMLILSHDQCRVVTLVN